MIPPFVYEEEEISLANHGRMRSSLSGRSAAISLRVRPLAPSVDGEIKDDNVECKEELIAIGRALNVDNFESPEEVLQDLLSSVCALDTHGNALVEFAGVQQGSFLRAIEPMEVYFHRETPQIRTLTLKAEPKIATIETSRAGESERRHDDAFGRSSSLRVQYSSILMSLWTLEHKQLVK